MVVQDHFNDLVVGTYGRGFWIMDDITPLQQLTNQVLASDVHLFVPRPTYRMHSIAGGPRAMARANINYYLKKGFLKPPCHVQLVLGVPGGMPGNAESVAYLLPKIPEGSTWSITGIGKDHVPCMLLGLAEGCHGLRVGLEDNIFFDKGVLATNPQLVARAVEFGKLAGREIANAAEAREILGVTKPQL